MNTHPEPNNALIIAYLTGQATDAEITKFRTLIDIDPDFLSQVERLEAWLAPLDSDIDEVVPPAGLLEAIMLEIEADEKSNIKPPIAANDTHPVRFWRAIAIAASAIAVISLGSHWVIDEQAPTQTDQDRYLALLSGDTASPLVAIVYDPTTGQVVARLSNVEIPDDGDLELWLIREGSEGPVSLGLLERTDQDKVEFSIPESLNAQTDLLAVSLEARGGSKSAGPEGPVLYTGGVSALD